jgi:hypothetical protein
MRRENFLLKLIRFIGLRTPVRSRQTKRKSKKRAASPHDKVSQARAINRSRRVFRSTAREIEQGLALYKPSKTLVRRIARLDSCAVTSESKKYDDSLVEDYTVPSDPQLRKIYDELACTVDVSE